MGVPPDPSLAARMRGIEPSGIRKIFDLIATMDDPIDLSIGQPHYDPPAPLAEAACRAIRGGQNRYTVTQGLPELNQRLLQRIERRDGRRPEASLVTSGVSGGILLSFLALLDRDDEILLPDPNFMMYRHLANLCEARIRYYDLYPAQPDQPFRIDPEQLASLVGPKTKILFVNSPSNPTGGMLGAAELEAILRELARVSAGPVLVSFFDAASLQHLRRRLRVALGGRRSARVAVRLRVLREDLAAAGLRIVRVASLRRWFSEQRLLLAVRDELLDPAQR